MKDFKEFLLRGNLVDLAVGIVIGVAFGAVVTALVTDLITPLIAAIGGKPDFSASGSHQRQPVPLRLVPQRGHPFVVIAAVVFYLVVRPVNALMERRRVSRRPIRPSATARTA